MAQVEQARAAMQALAAAVQQTEAANAAMQQQGDSSEVGEAQQHSANSLAALSEAQSQMQGATAAAETAASLSAQRKTQSLAASRQQQEIRQQQVLGELAKASSGKSQDISKQMKGEQLDIQLARRNQSATPPTIGKDFKAIPGRKFMRTGGTPAEWFYVNQWYLLGPYDNAGRMNLQRVYPPQSIIDLNAQYVGKGGVPLTWSYDSFAEEMMVPSLGLGDYTIFYGYTEIYFEEAADLWIMIGSDDRSDLWINDMPVWRSGNQEKPWQIAEGYRKVHFKAGRNKLVFRLENGWFVMAFSLLIHTGDPGM